MGKAQALVRPILCGDDRRKQLALFFDCSGANHPAPSLKSPQRGLQTPQFILERHLPKRLLSCDRAGREIQNQRADPT